MRPTGYIKWSHCSLFQRTAEGLFALVNWLDIYSGSKLDISRDSHKYLRQSLPKQGCYITSQFIASSSAISRVTSGEHNHPQKFGGRGRGKGCHYHAFVTDCILKLRIRSGKFLFSLFFTMRKSSSGVESRHATQTSKTSFSLLLTCLTTAYSMEMTRNVYYTLDPYFLRLCNRLTRTIFTLDKLHKHQGNRAGNYHSHVMVSRRRGLQDEVIWHFRSHLRPAAWNAMEWT